VTNILAGIALFEVFHDVQYLSIVWIYNRNRVEKDRTVGGFMRFVFRRSGSLIGLYVGLVFAYGSFAYFNSQLQIDNIKRILTGVVAASGLLHFYYDGFIWKVRESATRASLGLTNDGTADIARQGILQGWLLHGMKWAAGFVLPVSMLCLWQIHGAGSDLDRAARVVGGVPTSVTHRFDYGVALENAGQRDEAMHQFQLVLAQKPTHAEAHFHVAELLGDDAKFDPALEQIERAIALDPNNGEFHFRRGEILRRIGRTDEAIAEYEQSSKLDARVAQPHFAYADLLVAQNKLNESIAEYRAGLRIKPAEMTAHFRLGKVLAATEQFDQARTEFEAAVRLDPTLAAGHNNLGSIYVRLGRIDDAIAEFSEAARLQPDDDTFGENLRMARSLKEKSGDSLR
jgi:tetratricopeptide (TPR) repeat protein